MDRHGLLEVVRRLDQACRVRQATHVAQTQIWNWDCTALMFPESRCVFCGGIIKSSGIWLLRGEHQEMLVGVLFPGIDSKVTLRQPKHAHMLTSNKLCLGSHRSGVELIAAPVYLNGVSMTRMYVPRWLKRYWNHDCPQMRQFIIDECIRNENSSSSPILIRELDTPWSMS